jgi:DNA-binding beta-propeller fold protein YncE
MAGGRRLPFSLLLALCAAAAPLPTGRGIRPAGERIALDTFPWQAIAVPGRDAALVLHSGFRPPSLDLLDLKTRQIAARVPLADAGYSMAWEAKRRRLYVAGGYGSSVQVIEWNGNTLTALPPWEITGEAADRRMVASVALSGDGAKLAVIETLQDAVAVYALPERRLLRRIAGLARPTAAGFSSDGRYLYVAEAGGPRVSRIHLNSGETEPGPAVAAGPSDLLLYEQRLYVACANSNFVDVLRAEPGQPLRAGERWNLALTPGQPENVSPSRLTLSPGAGTLYVTLSDANAIALLDPRDGRLQGLIPTGWYPTGVAPFADGRLLVLNAKGFGSRPNPRGPDPTRHRTMTPQPPSDIEYIPLVQLGGAQWLPKLDARALEAATRDVRATNAPVRSRRAGLPKGHPLPARPGGRSPIRHVIYIMKENRTYDQVLGDLEIGNGDPSLCLFPEKITPNHHALAREFTLLDNFYVNADVSAEGWHWSSAAIVPHYIMRSWPAAYAGRRRPLPPAPPQPSGQEDPLTRPEAGYLWTEAIRRGIPFRNFGFFVRNTPGARYGTEVVAGVSDPALLPYTSPRYAGYDPDFPDVDRARVFLEELAGWEQAGEMPRLAVMVLPNDHTWGTAPGKLTPYASMADNDLALGRIVEGVSRSRFWPHTAIFVLEDDAQNGPDHVDSHRAPAYVISPYSRGKRVDSTFYNTTSMLRTIEWILGLSALTHYDAQAPLMVDVFGGRPDSRPYTARPAQVPLTTLNPPQSEAAALDFSRPDAIDDAVLNAILWRALQGQDPPPPVRSVFLR